MENKELIKKWLNGEITPGERPALENLQEYHDYKRIAEHASRFQKPPFDEEGTYSRLQERINKKPAGKVRKLHFPAMLKIAAVLLLLLASGWFIYYNTPKSFTTGTGEISFVELPDNSEVRLNAESKIKYYPRKWNGSRSLNLEGEAFFEVETGSRFTVETNQGTVQVLGTSFNVKSRPGFFEVTCYEGSVIVTFNSREEILLPGEFYKVIENEAKAGTTEAGNMPAWISRESSFEAVPLKFVLAEIERQFEIKIEAGNIDREQIFSGTFSHLDLEVALKSITIPLGLEYRIGDDSKIILYEE